MPLSQQILLEAIKSAHDECKDGCIHADALAAQVDNIVTLAALSVVETGINPTVGLLAEAFHIGYRAAQLVQNKRDKSQVASNKAVN